jgi:hypothetical protein
MTAVCTFAIARNAVPRLCYLCCGECCAGFKLWRCERAGKSEPVWTNSALTPGLLSVVQALPDLRSSYVPEVPAQVEFCASRSWVHIWSAVACMYIQGSPAEIQTPTHWNLISRCMTTPPPLLSPSSTLLPSWSHCAFILTRKNSVPVPKMLFQFFSFFSCVTYNCRSRGLC